MLLAWLPRWCAATGRSSSLYVSSKVIKTFGDDQEYMAALSEPCSVSVMHRVPWCRPTMMTIPLSLSPSLSLSLSLSLPLYLSLSHTHRQTDTHANTPSPTHTHARRHAGTPHTHTHTHTQELRTGSLTDMHAAVPAQKCTRTGDMHGSPNGQ